MDVIEHTLRSAAYPVEAIDPLSLAPDPGEMSELYVTARQSPDYPQGYPDGMTLACSVPLIPYPEIRARYVQERDDPDFDPRTFWDRNFLVPSFDQSHIVAPNGMPIDDYIRQARPYFIKKAVEMSAAEGGGVGFDFNVPYDMSTAGGRFGLHMFPHDIHQIMKGYAAAGRWDQVINSVDNLEYMINMLGYAPNGNSGIYATRFQIPYFSRGVGMLYEKFGEEALIRYLPTLEREYGFLMRGRAELSDTRPGMAVAAEAVVHMPDGSFLNRYWDSGHGPRLESYKEDVEMGELVVAGLTGAAREARLAKFYKDMRGGAASGWDYSRRWMKDGSNIETIATTDIVPVDLNSLMLGSEELLAAAWRVASRRAPIDSGEAAFALLRSDEFRETAGRRFLSMNKYLLDPKTQTMGDYDFVESRLTGFDSSAMAYPMYAGMTSKEQTLGTVRALREKFLLAGGIISTLVETGEQWDGKRAWASPNWAAARGAARMAHKLFAREVITTAEFEEIMSFAEGVRHNFMFGVETQYDLNGLFVEKVWAEDPTQLAAGGEYAPVSILNMTMETYAAMKEWNPRDPEGCSQLGHIALNYHD